MKLYNILQLNTTKYVILDENFKRLLRTGVEPVDQAKKNRVMLTLGQTILFIKKNPGAYTTFLKFDVPQLNRALNEHDIARKINSNASHHPR